MFEPHAKGNVNARETEIKWGRRRQLGGLATKQTVEMASHSAKHNGRVTVCANESCGGIGCAQLYARVFLEFKLGRDLEGKQRLVPATRSPTVADTKTGEHEASQGATSRIRSNTSQSLITCSY